MRCWRSIERSGTAVGGAAGPAWLAGLVLLLGCAAAHAAQFSIRDAELRLVDGMYLLNAAIDFDFSDESVEALENGVPLTVILDMEILRERRFLWDETVAAREARLRLEVHALSGQYVLKNLENGRVRTFRTLEEARKGLGTVRGLPMLRGDLLEKDRNYTLRLRARLDIEALPSPLRPLAYLSSLWRLSSDWYAWTIQR